MRDDLLKEQLLHYARSGAEAAFQPGADAIHRRARRHYRRVAALAVAGLLVLAGVGAGLGLGRGGGTPTVDQPPPTTTSPAPVPSAGRLPGTFADGGDGRVTLRSSTSGKVVRKLVGSPASGPRNYALGIAPDRRTVFFSQEGLELCSQAGIFRVPTGGGAAVRVVAGENAAGQIKFSADGARLAYAAVPCPSTGQPVDLVVRDASGRLVRRWPGASAGLDLRADHPTLSPDGRLLAVPVFDQLTSVGIRVLDVARDRSIADGRLIRASRPRCQLVQAEFHPRTGQLAVFERCLAQDPQSETPPRFQLRYLDPGTGRVQARLLAFDDHTGADLHVSNMDFDQSGRHLLYMVTSADPADSQEPRPVTGTWRYNGGDQPVRIGDDRRSEGGERVTSYFPSW